MATEQPTPPPKGDTVASSNEPAPGPDGLQTTYSRRALTLVRLLSDALSLGLAVAGALTLRFALEMFEVTESSPLTVRAHALASAVWTLAALGAFGLNRLYDEDTLFTGGGEGARVLRSIVEAMAVLAALVFLTQSFYVSRSWFGLTALLSAVSVLCERRLFRWHLDRRRGQGQWRRPAILVSKAGADWADWPLEQEAEFDVIARVEPDRFDEALEGFASRRDLDTAVILRARDFTSDEFWTILIKSGERNWSVFVHSPVRSVGRDRLTVRELGGQTIVKVAPPTLTAGRAVQKRIFDIVLAALFAILLSPLWLAAGLLVGLSSGRPILYKQERVGLNGRTFAMLKFRTMRRDAEQVSGAVWAEPDDPRRTRVGAGLRRTSLDELPQLYNVLKGDMSLVGPRPERPGFAGRFSEDIEWYRFRHRIRPGLTGWAQAHGLRGNTPLDSRVTHDNWYIENWSIWLDLKILARTLSEVFRGTNAY